MYSTSWNEFIGKNSKNLTNAFEDLARFLFRKTYNVPFALPYYKNHPGNETEVIERDGEIIGFQAKYFENEIDANNIIHSIEKAKEWNPNQTKIIIYTNKEFGIPKGSRINRKQQSIQDAAENNGLKIEWMFGDNILDAVKEHPLAYDIFFNLKSHIQDLPHDVEESNEAKFARINGEIVYGDNVFTIDRKDYVKKINEHICNKQNIVIIGESGSGKSAIVKNYYAQAKENIDTVFFVLDGRQLDTSRINDLFALGQNYSFKEFCDYYREFKTKIIYVDSAEKLLECTGSSVPLLLFDKLRKEGWTLVFTCKANCRKDFLEVISQDYGIHTVIMEVLPISKTELVSFAENYSIVLPNDNKLLVQLCLPFYLARYVELGSNTQMDCSSFRERVWKIKVRGNVRGGVQQKREDCLVDLARQLQMYPKYYVGYSDIKDKDAAYLLMEEDVLTEVIHKGYTFKHDLYSDWALEYVMEQIITGQVKELNYLPHTVDYQNAFLHCLQEKTDDGATRLDSFCKAIFANELDYFWVSPVFYVIAMSKDKSRTFFERFDAQLKHDNYHWFNQFAKELYVSCKEIKEHFTYKGRQYPRFIPVGGGWSSVIDFMYRNQDEYFLNNTYIIYQVLLGFLGIGDAGPNEKRQAAILSLRIFKEEVNASRNGSTLYIQKPEEWCSLVCQYSAFLKDELTQIISDVVRNKWVDYDDPYFQLMEYVVRKANIYDVFPLCIQCHDVLPELLQLFWEERLEENKHRAFYGYSYRDSEYYYGLDEGLGIEGYFPSSAFQTPVYPMLMTEYSICPKLQNTIDFIIKFVDKCVDVYKERRTEGDNIEKIRVLLPNGTYKEIIASQVLWNMYRGTSGFPAPHVLECVHMALEKFLLKLCDDNKNKEYVSKILTKILNESKSISLWAVVASIALAHYDEYFDILLVFYQDYRFLSYDLTRCTHELSAEIWAVEGIGREYIVKERKASNELKHRQYHLESWLQRLLVCYDASEKSQEKERLLKLYACVDVIKNQVALIPQEKKRHEDFMVARIDYRSLIKEEVSLKDGVKAIKVTPNLTPEQKKESLKIDEENRQMTRCVNLRKWIENQYSECHDVSSKSPFDDNPKAVLDEIRYIEKLLGSEDTAIHRLAGDEFLPCMGSGILLMTFSDKLDAMELNECKQRLFTVLKDMGPFLEKTFTELEVCLNVIPSLLRFSDKEDEVELRKICLAFIRSTYKYGNTRPCDTMRYMMVKNEMWKHHTSFMESCLQEIVEAPISQDATEIDRARATLCILANDTSHMDLTVKCMEIMSSEWMPKTNRNHDSYSQERFDDADLVSDIIINANEDKIPQMLSFFCRYISKDNRYEPLIRYFIFKCLHYGSYEKFWIVWYSLYESIIKGITKRDRSEIIQYYLLDLSTNVKYEEKWFDFKEKDISFFQRVLNDVGDNPSVLNSVVKVFDTIASEYALNIVPAISSVIEDKDVYTGERSVMKTLTFNLEGFMRRIFADYENIIYKDKQLKQRVKTILLFMKQHESSQASDLLRNI